MNYIITQFIDVENKCLKMYNSIAMYNLKKIFSQNVRRIRLQKNMTQQQFADLLGIDLKTISNFETGRHMPNSKRFEEICNTLSLEPKEFFMMSSEQTTDEKDKADRIFSMLTRLNGEKLDNVYKIVSALCD